MSQNNENNKKDSGKDKKINITTKNNNAGTIIKTIFTIFACICVFPIDNSSILSWNVLILNVPYLIDCCETKIIPNSVPSWGFLIFRTIIISVLSIVSFCSLMILFLEDNFGDNYITFLTPLIEFIKAFSFSSVAAVIFIGLSKIYMDDCRKENTDNGDCQNCDTK